MKKNIIQFEPAILTKRNFKEYKGYKHSIAFKINKLSSQLKRFTVRKFRKYGLGNPELIIISLIGQIKDKTTVNDLASIHWMDKGFISRASIKLINLGILRKINSPIDKRSHTLELTPRGKKIFFELRDLKKRRYTKLVGNLTNEQIILFNRILDKVMSNSEINLIK
ncbi:MAG: hypothetical protein CL687_01375 [Candidatus Pelagibacter sp.]|nr:hypothetical protein [Candidatus Pelagibacter sp.]OUW24485.1 MAG: hypothetical protein CBD34_00650 [Rickettsiales bacterium TMED174]